MKKILFVILINIWVSEIRAQDFENQKTAIEKAHENVSLIKKNFKKALMDAVQLKGPQGALGDCKIMAPQLELKGASLEIGRTSHKLRNVNNKPRDWVRPILDDYVKSPRSKHKSQQIISLGPKHLGYVEPLYVEAVCLNCHGGHLNSGVKKELARLYPEDQATGFQLGDFRGLIWLESKTP